MRTHIAKLLWKLKHLAGDLCMFICDHKALQDAEFNGYRTNYCWTCGKCGVKK